MSIFLFEFTTLSFFRFCSTPLNIGKLNEFTKMLQLIKGGIMIEIKNLTVEHPITGRLYEDLNLSLKRGHITCIIAPKGSGKTTLLNTLRGELTSDTGHVVINGIDTNSKYQAPECKVMYQNFQLYNDLTGKANFVFAITTDGTSLSLEQIKKLFINYDLYQVIDHKVADYTDLQRRQLALLITTCGTADYYLFDEPTTGLNQHGREIIWSKLRQLAAADKAVVIVSSSVHELLDFDQAVVLNTGKMIWEDFRV